MPGKMIPGKRPLPLRTRQIFNTRGQLINAMLPVTAKQAKAVKPAKGKKPSKRKGFR